MTNGSAKLAAIALVVSAVCFLGGAFMFAFVLDIAGENRALIQRDAAQDARTDRAIDQLSAALLRLQRLEHPTDVEFRRLLRRIIDSLSDPDSRAERERVQRLLRDEQEGGGSDGGGNNPPSGSP